MHARNYNGVMSPGALRRQLDEAVAPQDRQNAAEAYKMAQALAARCPDMPRDYTAFVIDSSTEGELRAYVKSYIYFHEYFESRIKDIESFEKLIQERSRACGSLF